MKISPPLGGESLGALDFNSIDTTDADSGGSADASLELGHVDTTDADSGGSHGATDDFSDVDFSDVDSGGSVSGSADAFASDFDAGDFDVSDDFGGDGFDGGFDADSFGDIGDVWPIVIDMDGDGVQITPVHESTAFFDMNDDGFRNLTGWAGPGDGLLAYDRDADGAITSIDEIAFIGYQEGAASDLEGLRAFDTNEDGNLSGDDAQWNQFGVWIDANQDGVSDAGEFLSLDDHGITELSLTSDGVEQPLDDGGRVLGTTTATTDSGEILAAADAVLRYTETGYHTTEDGYIVFGAGDSQRFGVADGDGGVSIDLGESGLSGFLGGGGTDVINAGAAADVVISGGPGDDHVLGGRGNDWLSGGDGADRLLGGDGGDVLFFDSADIAAGSVDGGAGFDIGVVEGADGINVTAGELGVEALIGHTGNDVLAAGTADAVYLAGGIGDDQLVGGDGQDFLVGGLGADSLSGGEGDDFLFVDEHDHGHGISGGSGFDTLVVDTTNGLEADLGAMSVELAFGNLGNDVLDATTATVSMVIDGGAGNDVLMGGLADDLLIGSSGSDSIDGGAGFDAATYAGLLEAHLIAFDRGTGQYRVENTLTTDVDVLRNVEALTFGKQVVQLSDTEITSLNASGEFTGTGAGEVFAGTTGNDVVYAANGDDLLIGGDGNDHLRGQSGDDYLNGGLGDDRVVGGQGNDFILGGAGDDFIAGHQGDDHIFAGAGDDTLRGGTGHDVMYGGSGNDRIGGRAGDDLIFGGDGDDWIAGGGGDDVISSGAGDDIVHNGGGDDVLIFDAGDGRDDFRLWDPDWANAHDTVLFGQGINHTDLWVSFDSDHDLVFDLIGTQDQVSIHNWQLGRWARPEAIETAAGYTLSEAGISQLVNAMAQFSQGPPCAAVLEDPQVRVQLNDAIAAAWQPKEAVA